MPYTMKQTCELTGLTYDTLKFYCNEGLVPYVSRDKNNRRIFDKRNIEWIKSLLCLRNCGLSISEMKQYVTLCQQGEPSIPERQAILDEKLKCLYAKIAEIEDSIHYIQKKQQFFQDILDGKREYYSNLVNRTS